jgi:hypothetical protein
MTGSDLYRLKEMEEEDCCPTRSREALPQRWQIVGTVYGAA